MWWCVVLARNHAAAKTVLLLEKQVLAGSRLHLCRNIPPLPMQYVQCSMHSGRGVEDKTKLRFGTTMSVHATAVR